MPYTYFCKDEDIYKALMKYYEAYPEATNKEVAVAFNTYERKVAWWKESFALSSGHRERKKVSVNKLREAIEEIPEATQAQLAAILGISVSSVQKNIRKYNIAYQSKA